MLVLCTACTEDGSDATTRSVDVDGGTSTVVLLEAQSVEARPGDTIRIRHRGEHDPEFEQGVTHAFVSSPPGELPPLFVGGSEGVRPNPAVWGSCNGGTSSPTLIACPVAPVDGPRGWNGEDYWSLGAMVPGEERDLPLADDIALGTYGFVCVLHPRLTVDIKVTEQPKAAAPRPAPDLGPIAGSGPVVDNRREVTAGFETSDPAASVNSFVPAEVSIEAGRAVTWTVSSPDPHDVVFADHPVELTDTSPVDSVPHAPREGWNGRSDVWSGFLSTDPSAAAGSSFSLTFQAPGRYDYQCRFHPGMEGVVVVKPSR
jgi:plastocyanin